MGRIKKSLRSQSGFTLIELLVVVVILGVLAAIIVPGVMGLLGTGEEEAARTDFRGLQTEVMAGYVTHNAWPETNATDDVVVVDDEGVEHPVEAWNRILESDLYDDQDFNVDGSDWYAEANVTDIGSVEVDNNGVVFSEDALP